jgi:hypothetical protein
MNLHAPNIIAASTQHVLHRDYESRGVLKLEEVGAWKYAADPRTEILCCAYAVDNDPVKLWLPSDPPPPEFFEAAQNLDWETAAHNAQFEIALEHFILCRRYGFPKFLLSRQRCTMAMALACSLPPKLELAADALELIHRKDKAGQRLMLMLARPRRPRKDEDPQTLLWFDDEERCQRSITTPNKIWRSNANFIKPCGRCPPRSSSYGSLMCGSTLADFMLIGSSLKLPARLPDSQSPNSKPSSHTSPTAPLPPLIRLRG